MKRPWFFPLVGYALLALLLAPSAFLGQGVFGYHDFRHHHLPWRAWAAQQWAIGDVPWWASGAANGFPLLADGQGGFLYFPTMALFLLLPDGLALNWAVLGHHIFAAMGMWAFLSRLGLRGIAPFGGGVVFAFSGFLVSHAIYVGMQNGIAWLPWLLLATLSGRGWLTALGIGALGVAGHPQAAAFSGLLVAAHAIATLERSALVVWGAWATLGVLIASPQVAASLELSTFSMRDGGVDPGFGNLGAMPFLELVGFVLPAAFGLDRPADVTETYYHRGLGYWGQGVNSWEMCIYVGIPVAMLAFCGARRSRFWTAALVVACILMLGGPLWALLRLFPGFSFFRFPARFALVAVAALAVLCAYGLDEVRRGVRTAHVRRAGWYLLGIFTLSTGVVRFAIHTRSSEISAVLDAHFRRQVGPVPIPPSLGPLHAALPAPDPEDPSQIAGKVARILADLAQSTDPRSSRVWWPAALLVACALALHRPRWMAALIAADLIRFGHNYHPSLPFDAVTRAPAWLSDRMTELGGGRTTVLDRRVLIEQDEQLLTASMGLPLGTSDVLIPSPLMMVRNEALLAMAGLDVGDKGVAKWVRFLAHRDIARRMSVRFIASIHPMEAPGLIPRVRGKYSVVEDTTALPRFRVVPCVEAAATGDEAFAKLLVLDPARSVVIEGAGASACAAETGSATLAEYSEQAVSLDVAGPGTLVIADTWYPGWVATLDGSAVPIERADLIYRAISLPPGEHAVTLHYQPTRLLVLLGVSVVSLLLVVVGALSSAAFASGFPLRRMR